MATPTPSSDFPTGRTVPFPYDAPYPQQSDLMDALLQGCERKSQHGKTRMLLLESPTGTGKSLSLACASLAWLRHQEKVDLENVEKEDKGSSKSSASEVSTGLDWLDDWQPPDEQRDAREKILSTARDSRTNLSSELKKISLRYEDDNDENNERRLQRRENVLRSAVTKAMMEHRKSMRRQKKVKRKKDSKENEDFCLPKYDDSLTVYDSDDGGAQVERARSSAADFLNGSKLDGSSTGVLNHGESSKMASKTVADVKPGSGVRKIIYAARTHSQLSQFVSEVKRTAWGSSVRIVALGSRTSGLCGFLSKSGRSESHVTEACLDMQKGKSSNTANVGSKRSACSEGGSTGCPYKNDAAIDTLALHLLAQPTDVEEAAKLGAASMTCAYYASRAAVAAAELVVLPYAMLVSSSTRKALGLSLKNSLVLVDEAHNLPEAVRGLHSASLSLPVCSAALDQLAAYTTKYAERLCGRNLFFLGRLRKICQSMVKHLEEAATSAKSPSPSPGISSSSKQLRSTSEFLISLRLDSVNLFQLLRYMEHSRLSQKLLGFMSFINKVNKELEATNDGMAATADDNGNLRGLSKHVSPMSIVESFLEKLNLATQDGRVVTDVPNGDGGSRFSKDPTLRYILLHPASYCRDLLEEPHALCLVGGTLRPFGYVAAELSDRTEIVQHALEADVHLRNRPGGGTFHQSLVSAFTCSHVVSSSNVHLQAISCVRDQSGASVALDFRHPARMSQNVCRAVGMAIIRICKHVPHGVVVFLPSYSYESHLHRFWKTCYVPSEDGKQISILELLQKKKRLFREPKSSSQIESTLSEYGKACSSEHGALLLSVVGGKLSEGINFANDLARAVAVVGLPYADPTDPVLVEKLALLDRRQRGMSGREYYQNLCMRAVNQSVGRAIRHANDHAAIVLLDGRYTQQPRIASALPQWLTGSTPDWKDSRFTNLESAATRLDNFFSRFS